MTLIYRLRVNTVAALRGFPDYKYLIFILGNYSHFLNYSRR